MERTERLQKYLSAAGVASRRHAETLIVQGLVTVNGQVVTALGTKVGPRDVVCVSGKRVVPAARKIYVLLYKPRGYITTMSDPQGRKTVVDLIGSLPVRVYPVGRLDYDTEGLLLLTNDGELANALVHPRREIPKVYEARVQGQVTEQEMLQLRQGVELDDGLTSPAQVQILRYDAASDETRVEIVIHEGRNRQVRRMLAAVGHPVVIRLKRTGLAFLRLGRLRRGQFRLLSSGEIRRLMQVAALTPR